MNGLLMERLHVVKGLDPVANAFAGTVYSDVVDMSELQRVLFVVYIGVGAAGTSTFTVQATDDTSHSNSTALAHVSRAITSGDTEGAITARLAAGHIPAAQTSQILLFEVNESALADTGYKYVYLKAVESNAAAVLGCVLILGESKMPAATKESIID